MGTLPQTNNPNHDRRLAPSVAHHLLADVAHDKLREARAFARDKAASR